jgi:hypothetical protein
MEIEQKQYVYFVGTFYDTTLERAPNPENHYDLIVYTAKEDYRVISSLEGIFISDKKIEVHVKDFSSDNLLVRRAQTDLFEEKYSGKFYFNK